MLLDALQLTFFVPLKPLTRVKSIWLTAAAPNADVTLIAYAINTITLFIIYPPI
jgi:hypothetical protein